MFLALKKFSVTLKAIVKIQALYRKYQEGANFKKQRTCAIRIQSWHRAAVARKAFYAMMRGVVTLQALFRRKSEQRNYRMLKRSGWRLQTWYLRIRNAWKQKQSSHMLL